MKTRAHLGVPPVEPPFSGTYHRDVKVRTVFVVDDDEAVRDALAMLFRTAGLAVECFDSAAAFLKCSTLPRPCCLVLDIRMPGLTGLQLQDVLAERGLRLPILFITGHGDVPMAVRAMRKGAFDFLEKPFDDPQLLVQVLDALEHPAASGRATPRSTRERLEELSEREREVLDCVLEAKPSRQIAVDLLISVKTVEFHRARIMQKLGVRSVAELFRYCLAP
jgi:FixJ family two-component response regulator